MTPTPPQDREALVRRLSEARLAQNDALDAANTALNEVLDAGQALDAFDAAHRRLHEGGEA